jgi:hypothetical protein
MFFLLLFLCSPLSAQEITGELVLKAYLYTYPERVEKVEWKNGDWTIDAGGKTFYWAGGRLLPENLVSEKEKWTPLFFDIYPQNVPSPEIYSPEFTEYLRAQGSAEVQLKSDDQHRGFQSALHGDTRNAVELRLKRISFLDRTIVVHRDIEHALKRIEEAISSSRAGSPEISSFVENIGQISAYNWRAIRGTQRMSYHSWGLAVDIQPGRLRGRPIYWLWEQARSKNWMLIPPEQRWSPPEAVIRAFENEGFIWGGKWAMYDNMHFEYRPELHEINRLYAASLENSPAGAIRSAGEKSQDLHHIAPANLLSEPESTTTSFSFGKWLKKIFTRLTGVLKG